MSSVSTGIKRCYCATEDSTNCAPEPRWQKILTAKIAKEKIAKERPQRRHLNWALRKAWTGCERRLRAGMTAFTLTSGGVTLAVSPCWRITRGRKISATHRISARLFESSVPQNNNNDLAAEKGPACDVRHRFALSAVYDIPAWDRSGLVRAVSKDWHLSTVYQVQTGFPFTISVFGDTAIAGTELGENPIRANVRGSHCFPRELAPPKIGSIQRHLPRPRLYVWGCGTQFNLSAGHANAGSGVGPRL